VFLEGIPIIYEHGVGTECANVLPSTHVPSKGNETAAVADDVLGNLLNLIEPHEFTGTALEMAEDSCQGLEDSRARAIGAAVDVGLVGRGIDVLVERGRSAKGLVAQVALPGDAVPGLVGNRHCGAIRVTMPLQLTVGEHVVVVSGSDGSPDGFAIHVLCFGAGVGFQVMGDAAGGGEAGFTERARKLGTAMGARVEVLWGQC
jgi:hypothetical protein